MCRLLVLFGFEDQKLDTLFENKVHFSKKSKYRIYSYGFRGNYSFLHFEIQSSQYINVRKLFKGGNYKRKYGIYLM